ncbi:DUF4376 domain-containing protein [Acinetobacter junii]|uniref:DUF4376 domain-containing protein n=1 Tax=Acinetobacter junii TaxID=40215 RepID=UPI0024470B2D|nr:DUF4376 domain-containing protein [Acinetobacter junii]MDH0718353.1 DUF4376 domain-containing protein [Acinetobacter junii]
MTTIVKSNGEILMSMTGDFDQVKLNIPDDCIAVEDPPSLNNYYYDQGEWLAFPERPSIFHHFNYETKQWEDNRTLNEIKQSMWIEIKQQREAAEIGGFLFDGNLYDSDETSQRRILGADKFKVDQIEWTLKNNQVVKLTFDQLTKLQAALVEHISLCHQRARVARQKIDESSTIEELNRVKF